MRNRPFNRTSQREGERESECDSHIETMRKLVLNGLTNAHVTKLHNATRMAMGAYVG